MIKSDLDFVNKDDRTLVKKNGKIVAFIGERPHGGFYYAFGKPSASHYMSFDVDDYETAVSRIKEFAEEGEGVFSSRKSIKSNYVIYYNDGLSAWGRVRNGKLPDDFIDANGVGLVINPNVGAMQFNSPEEAKKWLEKHEDEWNPDWGEILEVDENGELYDLEGDCLTSSRKINSSYQTAINELEEYFERSGSGNDDEYTIYIGSPLSRNDEIHIGNICEDNDCDFAIGTYHVTIYPINSSRKITSAVDGGWRVDSSDVPEALDLFVEYFGEETALEEIAKAMGDYTLRENLEWIARQFGIAEDLEDSNTWDMYDEMLEVMGVSELFNNLTQAAGYDELAEDLAFIFRQYDFREWDK